MSTKVDSPFDLYNGKAYRSCLVYADGNTVFSASAERIDTGGAPVEESVTWKTATGHRKKRINVGNVGAMAKNTAVSVITCTPPSSFNPSKTSPPKSEKNILLRVDLRPADKGAQSDADVISLLRDFVNFTQGSFDCQPAR
ncbi:MULTISPECIES: hypothetical protein [unclassified Streptomyces]|uniref:hypothetical protein n=1 Tax=unclassified Streptomyces TaxID=2593676 RepID=UPI001367B77B|nr:MULTISPECIES: hypothetical protein [unclassified Streptomyces]MYY86315.1 hypothetical protein [Streptomyces sp. SID335]MYZ13395.1 hypothetical protein [Streptomyces sp. SID337]NDZ90052.1 hypothetical protein [Streptomyces sp. SID10115]NEB46408.1 hypothetical protein [Streptomyces sp. SID339]